MLLVGATHRGLNINDVSEMDIGDLVDYIITWNNMHAEDSDGKPLRATQNDFDSF